MGTGFASCSWSRPKTLGRKPMNINRRTINLSLYLNSLQQLPSITAADTKLARDIFEFAFEEGAPREIIFERGRLGDGAIWATHKWVGSDGHIHFTTLHMNENGVLENRNTGIRTALPASLGKYFFGGLFGPTEFSDAAQQFVDATVIRSIMQVYSCAEKEGSVRNCTDHKRGHQKITEEDAARKVRERQTFDILKQNLIDALNQETEKIWTEVDGYFENGDNDMIYFPEHEAEQIIKIIEAYQPYRFYSAQPNSLAKTRKHRNQAISMLRAIARTDLGLSFFAREHCNGGTFSLIDPCTTDDHPTCFKRVQYISCDYGISQDLNTNSPCTCNEEQTASTSLGKY